MPLVDFEREVFSECGAWKNFHDLEDSLSLDELMELFEASIERQNRIIKTLASAMGATFEEEGGDDKRFVADNPSKIQGFNIGYDTIET